jgi:hypothetical protein
MYIISVLTVIVIALQHKLYCLNNLHYNKVDGPVVLALLLNGGSVASSEIKFRLNYFH